MFTSAPTASSAPPMTSEVVRGTGTAPPVTTASSYRNSPSRATTNPNPMSARPVRIQASRVRSTASATRGSSASSGMGLLSRGGAWPGLKSRLYAVAAGPR
jgi:hypothetical protein